MLIYMKLHASIFDTNVNRGLNPSPPKKKKKKKTNLNTELKPTSWDVQQGPTLEGSWIHFD